MVAVVVVMIDEGADLVFEVARQIVVFQQYPVLQRLMPALDLALGLPGQPPTPGAAAHQVDWFYSALWTNFTPPLTSVICVR